MALTTFTAINLKRHLLNGPSLVFSMFLPILLFLLFGALQDYGAVMLKNGNVTAYVMVGMAVYGGITAAVSTVGTTVVEQSTGWGRQLALTPLTGTQLLLSQCVVILFRAAFPVAAVFITGALTSAEMDARSWALTFVLSVLVTLPFGFYGMIFGQLFKSDSAVNISSSALVLLAFAGNAFMPLPEFLMPFARFTPMYGAVSLARHPLSDGVQAISEAPGFVEDPLWYAIANVVGWTVIFASICMMLNKRQKGRQ